MKKQIKHSILISAVSLLTLSCGKISPTGKIEVKEEKIEDFTGINVEGKFRVFWVNSPTSRIEVETYPNIFDNLKIKVKDKQLFISEKRETKGVDFYNITIYSKYNPTDIKISDSVEFNVSGEITTNDIALNLKNNAKFIGALNSKKAKIDMSDLSLANFKGFTKDVDVKIKDTANILAPYWMVDNMNILAKNGVYAEVNVKDSLKGNIDDTSKMLYYNDPIRAFKIGKNTNVTNKKLE